MELTYSRDIPLIIGSTAVTATADNYQGIVFVNDHATTDLNITIDGNYSAPSGFQISAIKFGDADVIITPTNGATINGSTSAVTITTKYDGAVQFININNDNYLMLGTL